LQGIVKSFNGSTGLISPHQTSVVHELLHTAHVPSLLFHGHGLELGDLPGINSIPNKPLQASTGLRTLLCSLTCQD
jgi:hypothetical protein